MNDNGLVINPIVIILFICDLGCSANATSAEIIKCCPPDMQLIKHFDEKRHGYDCMPVPIQNETIADSSVSDYFNTIYSFRLIRNDQVLIPKCDINENHSSIEIHDSTVSVPATYCIDWYGGKLLGIFCENSKYNVIKLSKYHKCCRQGFVYDHTEHQCVIDSNNRVENFFEKLLRNDFTMFTIGPPKCLESEVMVVYKSHVHRMEMDDLRLRIEGKFGRTFCMDVSDDGNWIAQVCRSQEICDHIPCIQKCCNLGDVVYKKDEIPSYCAPNLDGINTAFHDFSDVELENFKPIEKNVKEFGVLNPKTCYRSFVQENTTFFNYKDGHLFYVNHIFKHEFYCVDRLYIDNSSFMATFLCITTDQAEFKYIATGLFVSSVFLLITILVYLCVPKLCNLHGKTLLGNVISSFIAGTTLAYVQCETYEMGETNDTLGIRRYCKVWAYLIYYGYISSFSWLNIMCIDIFLKIRSVTPQCGTNSKSKDLRQFIYYSIYAIGFPSMMTSMTYIIDTYKLISGDYLPNMGITTCWFDRQEKSRGMIVFFLVPIGLQIFVNCILFFMTAIYCNRVKNEIYRRNKNDDLKNAKKKKRFVQDFTKLKLIAKLFIIMGLTWSIEFLSITFDNQSKWLYLVDFMNITYGFWIFLIFVCKKTIWEKILERFGIRRPQNRPQNVTMSTLITSSR